MKTNEEVKAALKKLTETQEAMKKLTAALGIQEPVMITVAAVATVKALEWVVGQDDGHFDKLLSGLDDALEQTKAIEELEKMMKE